MDCSSADSSASRSRVDEMSLYGKFLAISVRGQMQYRASFLLQAFGQAVISIIEFVALAALFSRFGQLKGWTLPEVALLYGLSNASFALAELFASGFDHFDGLVKSGEFDRLLLRPHSTAFQVAARDLSMGKLGRLAQGLAVMAWSVWKLQAGWTLAKSILLMVSLAGGACLFAGLFVFYATWCFWTVENLELFNTVTYGGMEAAGYPLSIYNPWMRGLFTYVVPLGSVIFLPAQVLASIGGQVQGGFPWGWVTPLAGPLFLWLSLQAWSYGERHYRSTGS